MGKGLSAAIALGLALGLSACAIPTRQTDAFLAAPHDIPETAQVAGVPFVLQEANFCGPASLAMMMAAVGNAVPTETLAKEVYTPGKKGSLQSDLIGAARRNGMMAVEVKGLSALLHEIAAGHPVLIFENLGLSWYPAWHYAVAYGYDLSDPAVTMHSGSHEALHTDLRKFERSWLESDYWGLVVLKPGTLATSADELAHSGAGAGLEQLGRLREAELVYRSVLERWPSSLGSLIGMGNLRYAAKDAPGAARFLERAVRAHPSSAIAWHNLAIARGAMGEQKLARASAKQALLHASPPESDKYRASLHEWLE